MFPGAELVLACPHCAALARLALPDDAEPFGMITWTDGWQTAPALVRPPRVARCPGCQRSFWVGEADQLGFLLPGEERPPEQAGWDAAPVLTPLDEAGVRQARAEGLGSFPELELELRVLEWWRANDAFRCGDAPVGHPTSDQAVANMERMIEMTADGGEDLLLFRAEAQRQLGRFDDVIETLRGVGCSDYWPAKSRLVELTEAGSRKLDVLFVPKWEGEAPAEP
jgi:hypothetical protein